jgi:sugar lactone lactonase YvrE
MPAHADVDAEVALHLRMHLGECPRWFPAEALLRWVDIEERAVHTWRPATSGAPDRLERAGRVAAMAPAPGGLLLVEERRVLLLGPDRAEALAELTDVPPGARANDARVGPDGALWVGSTPAAGGDAVLLRVDGAGVTLCRSELGLSNGLGFSVDGRQMYAVDTFERVVWRNRVADHGVDGQPAEAFLSFESDLPDGIAVDAEDGVWVAFWGGGRVERFDATGRRTHVVRTPGAELSTAVALGGPDLRTLFVTTATDGESGHGPAAGALFRARVDVPGQVEHVAGAWARPREGVR